MTPAAPGSLLDPVCSMMVDAAVACCDTDWRERSSVDQTEN